MADNAGPSSDALEHRLSTRARQYDFYQLVQLLERLPGGAPIGHQGPVGQEAVRFRAEPSLAFPCSDVTGVRRLARTGVVGKYEITVSFMGLYGPATPLPTHYTEAVIAADIDTSNRRDFLDYFNHRLVAFAYRIWKKYRYYAVFEAEARDGMSARLFALMGVFAPVLRESAALYWPRLLASAGLLAMQTRSAEAIERVVAQYFFGVPTRMESFAFRRASIPEDKRLRLGMQGCRLGRETVLGERIPDRAGSCRLHIGPLTWERFQDFLPNGRDRPALESLLDLLIKDPLAIELRLTLTRPEQLGHPLQLGLDNPCGLGWSSWVGEPDEAVSVVDFVLRP